MAFAAASGYGNLPNGVWSPVIYSKQVLLSLKKASVADEVTNTEFQGEITQMGDTVKIIKQPVMTTKTYTRGTKLESTDIVDEDVTMTIDQAIYNQFQLDDIEVRQSHVDYMNMTADAASYAIRDAYDQDILGVMLSGAASANTVGSSGSPVTVGFGASNDYTPADLVSRLARLLNESNVPYESRFLIASPAFIEALRREDSKLFEAQITGDPESLARNVNLVTTRLLHGFKILESNNSPTANSNPTLIVGHKSATATAASILKNEIVRSTDTFADLNRTLYVYGRKVIRSEALGKAYITIGDV